MVKVKEDMTGWVMAEHGVPDSRLTVICQAEDYITPKGVHVAQYLCICDCGSNKNVVAQANSIKCGKIKSCGCLHKESASKCGKKNKKYNKFQLNLFDQHGEYGIGYCSNTGSEFYFDMNDYEKIKDYCWTESTKSTNEYRVLSAWDNVAKKHVKMHQLLDCAGWDHIDRNPFNNRRMNLRPATAQENSRNRSIAINNTTGIVGIYFRKDINKWVAQININDRSIHLGYFLNKIDAIKARLNAESQYFREFAPQRHLFKQYGITTQNECEEKHEKEMDS